MFVLVESDELASDPNVSSHVVWEGETSLYTL